MVHLRCDDKICSATQNMRRHSIRSNEKHRWSAPRQGAELCDGSLLDQFLLLYQHTVETLLDTLYPDSHANLKRAWSVLWTSQFIHRPSQFEWVVSSAFRGAAGVFSLQDWISDALLFDNNKNYRLIKYIAGGLFGRAFLAKAGGNEVVVKILLYSDEALALVEAKLAKVFENNGLGFKIFTDLQGPMSVDITDSDLTDLLRGPDFNEKPPVPPILLGKVLGWFAMERFTMDAKTFLLDDANLKNETAMQDFADGLAILIRTSIKMKCVHGDLHFGNIGISTSYFFPESDSLSPKKSGSHHHLSHNNFPRTVNSTPQRKAGPLIVKFIDFGRSIAASECDDTVVERLLHEHRMTVDAICTLGHIFDAFGILRSLLFSFSKRSVRESVAFAFPEESYPRQTILHRLFMRTEVLKVLQNLIQEFQPPSEFDRDSTKTLRAVSTIIKDVERHMRVDRDDAAFHEFTVSVDKTFLDLFDIWWPILSTVRGPPTIAKFSSNPASRPCVGIHCKHVKPAHIDGTEYERSASIRRQNKPSAMPRVGIYAQQAQKAQQAHTDGVKDARSTSKRLQKNASTRPRVGIYAQQAQHAHTDGAKDARSTSKRLQKNASTRPRVGIYAQQAQQTYTNLNASDGDLEDLESEDAFSKSTMLSKRARRIDGGQSLHVSPSASIDLDSTISDDGVDVDDYLRQRTLSPPRAGATKSHIE